MTDKEAMQNLKTVKRVFTLTSKELGLPQVNQFTVTCGFAIDALEKQTPKKPITYPNTNRADCPVCGATVRGIKDPFGDYCSKCGQKLDWGEEE